MAATTKAGTRHQLDSFCKYLTARNMASNTIGVYSYAVGQFYSLYPQLTPRNLQLYKVYLLEHYKPQTVNLRIRALNCFMEYRQASMGPVPVIKNRQASMGPVPMIKVQQKTYLDKIISQADYEYLKRRLLEDEEYSYYFIVRLITATGVRVSELTGFEVADVRRGYKDIYSKGNKMRRVYIPSSLMAQLEDWLDWLHRSRGPLFLNRFDAPITPSGIRAQLKVLALRYGLDPEVMYPHSFRHRFAKNFIEKCGDIALLADLLGHESIETTRIYLRRSSLEQYRIVNKVVDW